MVTSASINIFNARFIPVNVVVTDLYQIVNEASFHWYMLTSSTPNCLIISLLVSIALLSHVLLWHVDVRIEGWYSGFMPVIEPTNAFQTSLIWYEYNNHKVIHYIVTGHVGSFICGPSILVPYGYFGPQFSIPRLKTSWISDYILVDSIRTLI